MLLWWSYMQWLGNVFTAPVYHPGSPCDTETVPFEDRTFHVGVEIRRYSLIESRSFRLGSENRTFKICCGDC